MANLRENKGYTYGVYSMVASFLNNGMFMMGTEVGTEVCELATQATYEEIKRLCNEKVTREELEKVKSYIMGRTLSNIDGPFKMADTIKNLIIYGLDSDYFNNFINTIRHVNEEELNVLANKYLGKDDFTEIIVGK